MKIMQRLNDMEIDALAEVANIGSGHASTALSNLIGRRVDLAVSTNDVVSLDDLPNYILGSKKLIIGPKSLVAGVYAPVKGEILGNVMVFFNGRSTLLLSDLLQKKKLGTAVAIEMKNQKLLAEAGGVLCRSYLNAVSDFLELNISTGESRFISTFGEFIMDFALLGIYEKLEYAILLKTDFGIGSEIEGYFVLLLAAESVDALLDSIKRKLGEL